MTSEYAIARRRAYKRESNRRHRLRKAGLLPPIPTCENCGGNVNSTQWLPLCWSCAQGPRCKHRRAFLRLGVQLAAARGTIHDQTILDSIALAAIITEPGHISTTALRQLWHCSQPTVSRRLAAIQLANLADLTIANGGAHIHSIRWWHSTPAHVLPT